MRVYKFGQLALAVLAVLLVSSCGSTSKDSGSASTTTADELAGLKGDPLEVMWVGPLTGQVVQPEALAGANAAALAINKAGGVKGRPIVVSKCDEAGDPAKNEACAQTLTSSKAVATVGQFATGSNALIKAESADAIAAIGLIGINDDLLADSKASFAFAANSYGIVACAATMHAAGVNKIGTMVLNIDAAKQLSLGTQVVIKNLPGVSFTGEIATDVGSMDFSGPIQNAINQGAEGLVLAYPGQETAAVIQANAGRLKLCHAEGAVSDGALKKLGDASKDFRVQSALPSKSELPDSKLGQQFLDEFAAYRSATKDPATAPDIWKPGTTLNAWMSVYAFKQAAEALPDVTRQSIFDAFTNQKALTFEGLLVKPVDFTQVQPLPQLARLFNSNYRTYTWDVSSQTFVADGTNVYDPVKLVLGQTG